MSKEAQDDVLELQVNEEPYALIVQDISASRWPRISDASILVTNRRYKMFDGSTTCISIFAASRKLIHTKRHHQCNYDYCC